MPVAIEHWREQQGEGGVNLAALHGWLRREHGYDGSLRSVQRFWREAYPAPAIRARRRVETPAGAQAQVDWAHFPRVMVGGEAIDLVALHMVLSLSRQERSSGRESKDMLAWLGCHTGASAGLAGCRRRCGSTTRRPPWPEAPGPGASINTSYRRYATMLRFHVDACPPRQPQCKGKVERRVRDQRFAIDPLGRSSRTLEDAAAMDGRAADELGRTSDVPGHGPTVAESLGRGTREADPFARDLPEPFDDGR